MKNSGKKAQVDVSQPSSEACQAFLTDLVNGDESIVGLSLFQETATCHYQPTLPPKPNLPTLLSNLYSPTYSKMSEEDFDQVLKNVELVITAEQINFLENATVDQSNCLAWHEHRAGRITASIANECLHTRLDNPAKSLLKKILLPSPTPIRSPALEYGRESEKLMFETYCTSLGNMFHHSLEVKRTGMRICPTEPWLSASGDGRFTCACHGSGILEIKAPYRWRSHTPDEAAQDSDFYLDTQLELKKSHKYYAQIQLQMFVYDCQWCDFVVYFGEKRQFTVKTIPRDDSYLSNTLPQLRTFWERAVLPELLTRRLEESERQRKAVEESTDNKRYCYCKKDIDGVQMVGCDNPSCPHEWIHLSCIRPKRKTVPKGNWYCKDCKKAMKK